MVSASEWFDLLIARAGELRAAGVREVTHDGNRVVLAGVESDDRGVDAGDIQALMREREELSDPLNDPATYGMSGSRAPSFVYDTGDAGD
jgi:hypothetical protein